MNEQTDNIAFRLPLILATSRESVLQILSNSQYTTLFEYIEEVPNPRGRQWNYIFTTILTGGPNQQCILKFNEALYEEPQEDKPYIADWLCIKDHPLKRSFRGIITP